MLEPREPRAPIEKDALEIKREEEIKKLKKRLEELKKSSGNKQEIDKIDKEIMFYEFNVEHKDQKLSESDKEIMKKTLKKGMISPEKPEEK